ncbi:MAG: cytochrome C [Sideroxydans sp.]|nr:cytochrome C [Sideroxydans sp.]
MKSIVISMAAAAGLVVAGNALAADMPPLAKELNCTACHAIDHKVVGPAWADVSAKYKGAKTFNYNGKDYPLVDGLIMKVSKGGSGHWGSMPMPANDPSGAKKDKITQLVKFVLGLAK